MTYIIELCDNCGKETKKETLAKSFKGELRTIEINTECIDIPTLTTRCLCVECIKLAKAEFLELIEKSKFFEFSLF